MLIKEPGQININDKKKHLDAVKQHQGLRSCIEDDHHIRQKMHHKHTDQLSATGEIPVFLLRKGETPEIIIRIDCHQEKDQISGNLYHQIRQVLTYSTPRLK